MTWTKLGDEYSDEIACAGLGDAAYRTHSEAIGWLYRIEDTGLRIPKYVVRRFAGSTDYEVGIKDLVSAGYWRDRGDAWEIVHHADVIRQSLEAQRLKRERDKHAQRAHRRRQSAGGTPSDVSADVSAESAATQTDKQTVKPC